MAKQRLKQRWKKRALGPLAGGSINAKKNQASDEASKEHATRIDLKAATTGATATDDVTENTENAA